MSSTRAKRSVQRSLSPNSLHRAYPLPLVALDLKCLEGGMKKGKSSPINVESFLNEEASLSSVSEDVECESTTAVLGSRTPLNRCLRGPTGSYGVERCYRTLVLCLQKKVVECFCHLYREKTSRNKTLQRYFSSGSPERLKHVGTAMQDPYGILVGALLILRHVLPVDWARDSPGAVNEMCICSGALMLSLKTITAIGGDVGGGQCDIEKKAIGPIMYTVIEFLSARFRVPSVSLEHMKEVEGELLGSDTPIFSIVHNNPLTSAEEEMNNMCKSGLLRNQSEVMVLRGTTSFFLLSAMHNPERDVLEEMGTWATVNEIGAGLVSLAFTCTSAAAGCDMRHGYSNKIDRVARVFLGEGQSGHAMCFRHGAREIDATGGSVCSPSVSAALTPACLERARCVYHEAEQ